MMMQDRIIAFKNNHKYKNTNLLGTEQRFWKLFSACSVVGMGGGERKRMWAPCSGASEPAFQRVGRTTAWCSRCSASVGRHVCYRIFGQGENIWCFFSRIVRKADVNLFIYLPSSQLTSMDDIYPNYNILSSSISK